MFLCLRIPVGFDNLQNKITSIKFFKYCVVVKGFCLEYSIVEPPIYISLEHINCASL